jgi:uncharacterized Zn finger protein
MSISVTEFQRACPICSGYRQMINQKWRGYAYCSNCGAIWTIWRKNWHGSKVISAVSKVNTPAHDYAAP